MYSLSQLTLTAPSGREPNSVYIQTIAGVGGTVDNRSLRVCFRTTGNCPHTIGRIKRGIAIL